MSDLEIDKTYQRGEKGKKVRLIQEWLGLNGFKVLIDAEFGPATESAVKEFQSSKSLSSTGIVDQETFEQLVSSMKSALKDIPLNGMSIAELFVAYSQQHLAQHPLEIGGENGGPWVRLYMNGHEGPEWRWCAGFVCFCLRQACESLSLKIPIEASFSCDSLAASAKKKNIFLKEPSVQDRQKIKPGSIFLNRRTANDWVHTGLVVSADLEVFFTIEGNTNDQGSADGFEVCARTRGYKNKDFILI